MRQFMVRDVVSGLFLREVAREFVPIGEGRLWKQWGPARNAMHECVGRPMYDGCKFEVVAVKVTIELE